MIKKKNKTRGIKIPDIKFYYQIMVQKECATGIKLTYGSM